MATEQPYVRLNLRMSDEESEMVRYWSEKLGLSQNGFILDAIHSHTSTLNGDYTRYQDLLIPRVDQLIDVITEQSSRINNLEQTIVPAISTMVGLARGGSYLINEDEVDDL